MNLNIGDKITVLDTDGQIHPATVVKYANEHAVFQWECKAALCAAHGGTAGLAADKDEGVNWIRGHIYDMRDLDALRTACALGGRRAPTLPLP